MAEKGIQRREERLALRGGGSTCLVIGGKAGKTAWAGALVGLMLRRDFSQVASAFLSGEGELGRT